MATVSGVTLTASFGSQSTTGTDPLFRTLNIKVAVSVTKNTNTSVRYLHYRLVDQTDNSKELKYGNIKLAASATHYTTLNLSAIFAAPSTPVNTTVPRTIRFEVAVTTTASHPTSGYTLLKSFTYYLPTRKSYNIEFYDYANTLYRNQDPVYEGATFEMPDITESRFPRFKTWYCAASDTFNVGAGHQVRIPLINVNSTVKFTFRIYAIRKPVLRLKRNGEWVDTTAKVKVGDDWLNLVDGYVKKDGIWVSIEQ